MSKDIRGYYAQLGVTSNASANEIKAAYRALAKVHHPDAGTAADGGARFRKISEAYNVLSNAEARAAYDSECATETPRQGKARQDVVIEPISCGRCGQVTAQPRYVVFRQVMSFLLATVRTPIQGIYCSTCARKVAFRATLISAVGGWWGAPWGPIWTIAEGVKNAFGGSSIAAHEEKLLWHNALAFASRGESKLSFALANNLGGASDVEIAANAARLLEHFRASGIDYSSAGLVDSWRLQPGSVLMQLGVIAALPALLTALIMSQSDTPSVAPSTEGSTALYAPPPASEPVSRPPVDATPVAAATVETCKEALLNGQKLDGPMRREAEGHILEIENGSGGNAIIKIRSWPSNKLAASFLVFNNQKASFEGIPDGSYAIQYAYGDAIGADCKSFTKTTAAGQFPDMETLTTKEQAVEGGTQISHSRLSFTLYAVPGGNVRPQALDPAAFNAD